MGTTITASALVGGHIRNVEVVGTCDKLQVSGDDWDLRGVKLHELAQNASFPVTIGGDHNRLSDFHIGEYVTNADGAAIDLGGSDNQLDNWLQMDATQIDREGIRVGGDRNTLRGISLATGRDTNNTYDMIDVTGDKNTIVGATEINGTGANQARYTVHVEGTADATVLAAINQGEAVTGAIFNEGTNTSAPQQREHLLIFGESGTLSVGTGASELPLDFDGEVLNVRARVSTAPSGGACTIDVNLSGTSVFTGGSEPSISSGSNDSGDTTPDGTATFSAGAYLSVDKDAVNSAADLVVLVRVREDF